MNPNALFVLLPPDSTGINFINRITPDEITNILTYEYLYNGGGVGIGDFNNDGFQDIFFAGNQVPSKLYVNSGKSPSAHGGLPAGVQLGTQAGFHFRDVTETSGISIPKDWAFGVSVVDINQDGLQDIYINDRHPECPVLRD